MQAPLVVSCLLFIAGCGGRSPIGSGSDPSPAGTGQPGPLHGTVVDNEGQAYPGVELRIGSTKTTTDSSGHFDVADAPATYDVTTVRDGQGVYVFSGLTRRDPVIRLYSRYSLLNPTHYARVTIDVAPPDTERLKTVRFFELIGDAKTTSFSGEADATSELFIPHWTGAETIAIRLHAFQYEVDPATRAVLHYVGYDTTEQPVSWGGKINWTPTLHAVPFPEATVDVTAILPAGYRLGNARLLIAPSGSGSSVSLMERPQTNPHISFVVPDMPGATFGIDLAASSAAGVSSRLVNGLTPGSPALPVVVEQGPTLDAPLRDAVDVDVGTELKWTNPTGRPGFVMVLFMGDPHYPMYHLFTGGSRVAIPDLSEWGVRPPRRTEGKWAVFSTSAGTADVLAEYAAGQPDLPQTTYAYTGYRPFLSAE